MALTQLTKRRLSYAMGGWGRASDITTRISDGSSGTLKVWTERGLPYALRNRRASTLLITALEADSALSAYAKARLAKALGSQEAADDISAELG